MKSTIETLEGFVVLRLRGEFDTISCAPFLGEIDRLLSKGVTRVALNLRLVKFINSTAMGAIIRAAKALRERGGELVVSQPSSFARDVMGKIGLDSFVAIRGTDEGAVQVLADDGEDGAGRAYRDGANGAGGDREAVLEDEAALLFSLRDTERVEHFLPEESRAAAADPRHGHRFGANWRGVARMSALDEDGLRFSWNGGQTGLSPFVMGQLLALGTELELKFRLPLLQKGFCEAAATITGIAEGAEGVEVGATFGEMEPMVARAVEQYATDVRFLEDELRGAREEGS